MPSLPSLRFVPLADVAHLLPADSWIAKRLRDDPEGLADETAAWITGDMQWPELHLDTPLVADGGLHHLAQTQPDAAPCPAARLTWSSSKATCASTAHSPPATPMARRTWWCWAACRCSMR